ncbi:Polyisoprenoid-binding protein YceI [Paracoccus solventivorans]|uniref:Polyisoprenoid-binding protein YceI n=1 Tax=Paracoccus solventivorans TaxID=53463 RepID=A0A1M7DH43_9RHOB|nr:YceI family protein [Paracoccus solventivorans]SHL78728.1 Polyisoprenoid-binding protein YceI [Paracoccus solventivorans]
MRLRLSVLALAALLAGPGLAQNAAAPADGAAAPDAAAQPGDIGGTYEFDPEHSQIVFSYEHMGFSTSHGFVNGLEGSITLDAETPANSTVEARFPMSAIRTIAPALDKDIYGEGLVTAATPDSVVTFRSTRVEVRDEDEADVFGELTLNGVTREVKLEVELNKAGVNPMSNLPAVGFDIEGSILRSDFNMGGFAPAVSDELKINIAVEARKG